MNSPVATDHGVQPVLSVENLSHRYRVGGRGRRSVAAVRDVSFSIGPGRALGIVGETGSGKSTVARAVTWLVEPSEGRVVLEGADLAEQSAEQVRRMRRRMQIVFQDPHASLNRRRRAEESIRQPMEALGIGTTADREAKVAELLRLTGLSPEHAHAYPHQLSGGQAQRVNIARALSVDPSLLVLDEPVSALDVSTAAQIMNLLRALQDQLGIAFLMIAHDLAVVRYLCDTIAVMYFGEIVEIADRETLFADPRHPYTKSLMAAIPEAVPQRHGTTTDWTAEGEAPSPLDPPRGCPFRSRCPRGLTESVCAEVAPPLGELGAGRRVACHFADE